MERLAVLLERQLFFEIRLVAFRFDLKARLFDHVRQFGAALTYLPAFQADAFRRSPYEELERG